MTIEIKRNAKEITIEVVGRLDTITAPVLEKTVIDNIGNFGSRTRCYFLYFFNSVLFVAGVYAFG